MGYASQVASADAHLREKIEAAVIKTAAALAGGGGQYDALATAIVAQPRRGIDVLHLKVKTSNGITVESTDAAIDAAVFDAESIEVLRATYPGT